MEENEFNNDEINNLDEEKSERNIDENNNFYQGLQEDEEKYYENKKLKKVELKKNEIRLFYYSILELFTKKQYKKILELFKMKEKEQEEKKEKEKAIEEDKEKEEEENGDAIENEEKEEDITYKTEWIFQYLQTISIQNIIQKKIGRKNKPSFKRYIHQESEILNFWIQFINDLIINHKQSKEKIQCYLEFMIEFLIKKCINLAKSCIFQGNIREAIYFLSIGVYFINHTFNFFKSPVTFCSCGELFILLSGILIADNKYDTAKNMINFLIKLLYLSLEILFFTNPEQLSYTIFNILSQEKQNVFPIIKIIFYISISFYHLGVCFENQGKHYSSLFSYKQSKFFLSAIKDIFPDTNAFYDFIIRLENRQVMRNRLILFFQGFIKKEKLIEETKQSTETYNSLDILHQKRKKKFLRLEEYIANMKLIDVDNEDPHLFDKIDKQFNYNVNLATKQIHLLDYLMSHEFKKTLNNMKKIRINKLDYETLHLIQRQIINIKNNQREKLSKKNKNKKSNLKLLTDDNIFSKTINTIPSSKTFNTAKKTRVSSAYKTLMSDGNKSESIYHLKTRPSTAKNNRLKLSKVLEPQRLLTNFHSKKSLISNKNKMNLKLDFENQSIKQNLISLSVKANKNLNQNNIPKYSYDKYLFNKSFMRKKKNLEKQYANEINFQKKFLKSKEVEIEKPLPFNLKSVQTECEKFYMTTFDKEMMKIRDKKIILGNEYINNIMKKKLERKKKERKVTNLFLEFDENKKMDKYNLTENYIEDIDDNNYKYISSLLNDIIDLNKKEKILQKNYIKAKYLNM